LADNTWKIYSRNPNLPAARIGFGASLDECMVAEGCGVEGAVKHSLLFQEKPEIPIDFPMKAERYYFSQIAGNVQQN
jgi:hypothetical protein